LCRENEELSGGNFFISRRENKNYQRISNIPEIESLMREKGVEIIYAEDFTIEEQLIIYKSANTIFTVSGSAHNILFMCEGSKMVEIADSRTQ
jgi:capsular polysaccharide biosynthesis protein